MLNPNATRALENVARFRIPPTPENYYEGVWCYNSGYRDRATVAAFQLEGDSDTLSREVYHRGSAVFLFGEEGGREGATKEMAILRVIWGEGDAATFRLAVNSSTSGYDTRVGMPDFAYVNLLSSIDGSYGVTQSKRVHYVKARNVDACLRSLNNLEPCECSAR